MGFVRCTRLATLITFPLLLSPAIAETPPAGDPCVAALDGPTLTESRHTSRVRLEHDVAIYVAKHVQNACRLIGDFTGDDLIKGQPRWVNELRTVNNQLRATVLEPIYVEFPALRGQDLTTIATTIKFEPYGGSNDSAPRRQWMGPATAAYLRWTLGNAETNFLAVVHQQSCASVQDEKCLRWHEDVPAEFTFAAVPIYASYPDLWRLTLKERQWPLIERRTAESDAAFRYAEPAPGSVTLTPTASSTIRAMLASMQRDMGKGCWVASIGWSLASSWKGPNDSDWKTSGPSLFVGAYECRQIPPDVLQTIDGIPIVFAGDDASRFTGKIIDQKDGHLVLRDR